MDGNAGERKRPTGESALSGLEQLHRAVDALRAPLEARHAARLRCGPGCRDCCVDDLTVFEVEAERIRRSHPELLRNGAPHASGSCAFLDGAGDCRIYAERPYVCRTQGLPLRWLEWGDDGTGVELRDICPLNDDPSEPIETLEAQDCWEIGPFEQRLARLQEAFGAGSMSRVALRGLFARSAGT